MGTPERGQTRTFCIKEEADTSDARKTRKKLLEWLDCHEKRLLDWVAEITAAERELGIENDGFSPVKPKK